MNLVLFFGILLVTAVAMVLLVYIFLNKMSENLSKQGDKEIRHLQFELKKQRQEFFLPNRMEAYQRSILLMERLHPNSLVMRLHNPGLPAKALQAEFLKSIRDEYNHNVAQQLFVSPLAWKMVKDSKEEIVKLINLAGNQMSGTSTGIELSSKIFEILSQMDQIPSDITVEFLKKEFQELF
jgi:hypothetical protein